VIQNTIVKPPKVDLVSGPEPSDDLSPILAKTDPPVSEPNAAIASSAATAAAEPPLDPPGMRARSHGLRVGFTPEFSVEEPIANSSIFVRPKGIAPAAFSLAIAVASNIPR
jgi:hypothetical protein